MTIREIETCIDIISKTIDIHNEHLEKIEADIKKLQVQLGEADADAKSALYRIKKLEEL